jgi:hypothetical protein
MIETIKNLLGLSDETAIIQKFPIVESAVCSYCRRYFADMEYTTQSGNFIFGTDNSIIINNVTDLNIGDRIRFLNTHRNSLKTFTINSIINTKIYVNETVLEEIKDSVILRINYPLDLYNIFAQMIQYNIDMTKNTIGVKSEKIDDYSIEFSANTINGYPSLIMESLNNYRKVFHNVY